MIPKTHRLILSPTNQFVGRRHYGKWTTVIVAEGDSPRWAVTISKKIHPLATARNLLRRQLNHWLYQHRDQLKPQQFLIILRQKPNPEDMLPLFDELKQTLFTLNS